MTKATAKALSEIHITTSWTYHLKLLFLGMQSTFVQPLLVEAFNERLVLDPRGVMYWKRKRWLIISDLHLGKSMHFRKKGMAIPGDMDVSDIKLIEDLIQDYEPNRVVFLGDLFHSDYNIEWERLAAFTQRYKKEYFILVKGNHDILPDWHYGRTRLAVVDDINAGPFLFTHFPLKNPGNKINVCGHLHPAVRLYGKGRQSVRLPAFFFRAQSILIPAFGRFTGSVSIKPLKSDRVFGIADGQIVEC
jgi:DNA ligase-associated metallophosphoesterase